jgi:single-strand DNA-binding protein
MNLIVISGNLCKDNELRYTESRKPVINNTLAVNKRRKKEDGTYDTDFIEVVFWNATAEFLHKYTKKGDKISVTGSLNTRNYVNSDGVKKYITEVIADSVEILFTRDKKEVSNQEDAFGGVTSVKIDEIEIQDSEFPF